MYILQLLGLKISSSTNLTLSHLVTTVKRKLIKMYTSYWNQERDKHMNSGKHDTYSSLPGKIILRKMILVKRVI